MNISAFQYPIQGPDPEPGTLASPGYKPQGNTCI